MTRVFPLSDGNGFYRCCERLLGPRLRSRPVIVLSDNDGAPLRARRSRRRGGSKWETLAQIRAARFEAAGEVARSSNYALCGDISRRLNVVYRWFSPEVELYSIDESFVELGHEAVMYQFEIEAA